jgi:hypothetical protein
MSYNPCTNASSKSKTLCVCPSTPVEPNVIGENDIVTKIPVVLSELVIQIDVEACIELEHPAFEIKRIKKDVILTQAKLLPYASFFNPETGEFNGGKLFLKGYIRKNIEYATAECKAKGEDSCCCDTGKVIAGDIKHTTAYVPFHCVTEVEYNTNARPIVRYRESTKEIEIFRNCQYNCFGKCTPEYIGSDFCQYNFEDAIGYTEGFGIELEETYINEIDFEKHYRGYRKDEENNCSHKPYPGLFDELLEKIVLNIKLKILQDQQVRVQSLGPVVL